MLASPLNVITIARMTIAMYYMKYEREICMGFYFHTVDLYLYCIVFVLKYSLLIGYNSYELLMNLFTVCYSANSVTSL